MSFALSKATSTPISPVVLPRNLAYCAAQQFAGEDMRLTALDEADIAAALHLLPPARACCAPAEAADIQAWMEVIALSVGPNAPVQMARDARIALVIETCGDLPAGCWTPSSRVQFTRTRGAKSAFFPTDGEVDAILRPMARMMRLSLKTLEATVAEGERRRRPVPKVAVEDMPANQLAGAARDRVVAHVQAATRDWLRSRVPVIVETVQEKPARLASALKGRDLWLTRNRARQDAGLPRLPEPKSFVGYGE